MKCCSILLVSLLCCSLLEVTVGQVDSSSLLWPLPAKVTAAGSTVKYLDTEKFMFNTDINSDLLNKAFQRYTGLLFQTPSAILPDGAPDKSTVELKMLTVKVTDGDETLDADTDESYELDTDQGTLQAKTVYGALRGLETFSQLVYQNKFQQYLINSVTITDSPRFKFRASMIDTSRHFLPIQVIYDHLDAMSYSKFNVLHWHIVDDQSFPYTSTTFPNLTIAGAYDQSHTYSQQQIADVIEFAKMRGIRVIVEFDTPGHTQSWGKGQSGFLTECYSNGKPSGSYGPVDPTLDTTWTFLQSFFTEIAKVFPDKYIHLGGDEVSFSCWQSNPHIQQWMKQNNYTDYSKLEQYYETRLLKMVGDLGKLYIVWQEIFDNKLTVLPDTIINVWKGGWQKEVFSVTKAGLKTILSSCWYLNYISYGSDWTKYYTCDPQDFNGTDAQNALVVGGETCMWGEFVDATNFLSRYWPRACAVSEKLWSPKASTTSTGAAEPRLHTMRCRLLSRQIPAEPLQPSYCHFEWPGTES